MTFYLFIYFYRHYYFFTSLYWEWNWHTLNLCRKEVWKILSISTRKEIMMKRTEIIYYFPHIWRECDVFNATSCIIRTIEKTMRKIQGAWIRSWKVNRPQKVDILAYKFSLSLNKTLSRGSWNRLSLLRAFSADKNHNRSQAEDDCHTASRSYISLVNVKMNMKYKGSGFPF